MTWEEQVKKTIGLYISSAGNDTTALVRIQDLREIIKLVNTYESRRLKIEDTMMSIHNPTGNAYIAGKHMGLNIAWGIMWGIEADGEG